MIPCNYYSYTEPAGPDMFCGRDEDVKILVQRLIETPGQSFVLVGGRRIGKTSFLEALYRGIEQAQSDGALKLLPVPLRLDVATLSSLGAFFQGVERQAQESLRGWLESPKEERASESRRWDQEVFAQRLRHWAREMGKQRGCGLRLVLLLDKCDSTIDQPWVNDLYIALHNLLDGALTRPHLKLVMAGSPGFISQVYHRGSPLGNKLKSYDLRGLDDQATRRLITGKAGVNFPPEVIQAVVDQSGGHPFLVQYLMQHLCDGDPKAATAETIRGFTRKFLHERSEFKAWADDLGPSALRIYDVLAEANTVYSESQLRTALRTPPTDFTLALDALCYHGLVLGDPDEDRYQCAGQMFRDWFRKHVAPRLSEGEPPDKSSIKKIAPRSRSQRGLRQEIEASYSLEDLTVLCFDLGVDHENIAGKTKPGMAVGLLTYFMHRERLSELLERLCEERPGVPWRDLPVSEMR